MTLKQWILTLIDSILNGIALAGISYFVIPKTTGELTAELWKLWIVALGGAIIGLLNHIRQSPISKITAGLLFALVFSMVLFLPIAAMAAPFLVCNAPAADEGVLGYRGTINGTSFDTPYSLHPSGAAIIYDCAGLGPGKWDFQNIRAYSLRGESTPGIPFVYPALPGIPANLHLVQ